MSIALHFGFDDGPIRRHLALLSILDRKGFDGARREIGEMLLGDVQDNLDEQKLADGSPMPQSKAAIARQGKTLIDKHQLYDSYTQQLTGDNGVEIGSTSVYAAIHHFGGETGRKGHRFTLPARPVLGVGPAQERAIGDFLIAEITKAQRT
jgi:phage virion morphogenesis protein